MPSNIKLIFALVIFLISFNTYSKLEIQSYKKKYSWDNSWNDSIASELDQKKDLIIMAGKIDSADLREIGCLGYNSVIDNELKKDFWIVFFSALTRAESAFNSHARSFDNYGLLQLAKATARIQCGLKNLDEMSDIDKHLRCGVRLMSWQLEGAPDSNGKKRRPDLKGQLFGKHILLWGPLRQNDKRGRALLTNWFQKHLDQLPFCLEKV